MFLESIEISDGQYGGTISGHEVKFQFNGREIYAITDLGIRGINVPVRFEVKNCKVIESSIEVTK